MDGGFSGDEKLMDALIVLIDSWGNLLMADIFCCGAVWGIFVSAA